MKHQVAAEKTIGRPRAFDREAALEQAMLLFWRHGYEATSLGDLRAAMGINSPSIYAAFGDKKQLFLAAVDRYVGGPVTSQSIIDNAADAKAAIRNLLHAAVIGFTGKTTPSGCLLATSAISCSADAADVQAKLAQIRHDIEKCLRGKIQESIARRVMPTHIDASILAALVMATIQGMSTLARDGASRRKLAAAAEMFSRNLP